VANANVLVGFDTADDAGVYKLTAELALVQTVDFFTPIVDDPYTYGAIAAANALSDVYRHGRAGPLTRALDTGLAGGGRDRGLQADSERRARTRFTKPAVSFWADTALPTKKSNSATRVTGTIHPNRVFANAGARAGDALVLTKRVGTGVIATALKRGIADATHVQTSIDSMLTLNRAACEAMLAFDVHGCTDVTGFGMIGHAREMALASRVTIEIDSTTVPLLPGALEYSRQGALAGGLKNKPRICFRRGRESARASGRAGKPALRPADFRWPAHFASGGRRCAIDSKTGRGAPRWPCPAGRQSHSLAMTDSPIIIALDVASPDEARALVGRLGAHVNFYKVGMELYAAAGMQFVHELIAQGKDVFLDMKFYDIGETVKRAVAQVASSGVFAFSPCTAAAR